MKAHKMPDMKEGVVNVTPLIDIVMCLIIFYMLVAKIGVATGADKNLVLPESLQGVNIKDMGNTVTLNVRRGGAGLPQVTTLDPKTGQVIQINVQEPGPGGSVREPLKDFLSVLKGQNEKFSVIIRGEEDLDYSFLQPVLLACAAAKVNTVNFATQVMERRVQQG